MTIAESMAIHRGKIVFVGSAVGGRKWIGPDTHRIDLQGGSHILLAVDENDLIRDRMNAARDDVRSLLRQNNV